MNKTTLISLLALLVLGGPAATGQSPDTKKEITAVALDYGEGWYEGNVQRMERALHPNLAKRMILTDSNTGVNRLSDMGAATLVENTRRGGGKNAPVEDRSSRVEILDIFENAAMVKVSGPEWVDYLQMARWNGRWVIVNVLWELRPETRERLTRRAEKKK